MYHRLLGSGQLGRLRGQRLCVSGSAPLSAELHAEVTATSGIVVLERYGMTETLMNVSNPYEGERRAGTVGFPLPGVEVRLARDGEILVRGPNVFDGYWRAPAGQRRGLRGACADRRGGSPWFRTGDLGEESDGYLVIRGRSKELIISGGFNVYPGEVEDVLATHPGGGRGGGDRDGVGRVGRGGHGVDRPRRSAPVGGGAGPVHRGRRWPPTSGPGWSTWWTALPRNALGKVVRSRLGA